MFETRELNTNGIQTTHSAIHIMQQQAQYIFLLTAGPTNWPSIANGFREKEILPTGGERYGEWFGSDLPLPTALALAITPGTIESPSLIVPAGLPSAP